MKADHLTFKRAAGVSLLGLALQLVMGLVLLIYSFILADRAGMAGSFLVLSGSLVWITLAIVFDQHRRERLEAMESEAMAAAGARESSVFGERGDELLVAARRLASMHKWLVPIASLLFAALLTGIGIWQLNRGLSIISADPLANAESVNKVAFKSLDQTAQGWAISIGLTMAFVGFIFARYVSGMAKQGPWANLRAGAAQSVAAALVGLAIAVGQFVDYFGPDYIAKYLLIAFPVLMLLIAAETVLNFLLGLYRPRRPGEIPKPAFESRVLGFVAAPDRIAESIGGAINYQFGFDVTGSWFYQLLTRSLTVLVIVGLAVIWGLTSIGIVQPNEQGLRVRFGARVGAPLGPGPYLKLPWPLETIERFDATTVRRVDLGGDQPKVKKSILWTNDHGVTETFFVVRPSAADIEAGREMEREKAATEPAPKLKSGGGGGGRDVSLVSAEVPLLFEVTDLAKYEMLAAPDQREEIIRAVGRREVFKYLATRTVEDVLGDARPEISRVLQERVSAKLESMDCGVRVLFVGIEGVHPPKDTAEMFESVAQSIQKRQGSIENGMMEANQTLIKVAGSVEMAHELVEAIDAVAAAPSPQRSELQLKAEELLAKAQGEAASKLAAAKADRWTKHMTARGKAERSTGQVASFRAAPSVYLAQVYFDTLTDIFKRARVYVVSGQANLEVRTDVSDTAASGNLFDEGKKPDEQ